MKLGNMLIGWLMIIAFLSGIVGFVSLINLNSIATGFEELDNKTLRANIQNAGNIIFALTVIALFLALALGIFIANSIAKPLQKITDAVNEVSRGRLDVTIEKSRIDEINKLAEALDRIMTTMKLSIKRLREKE